MGLKEIKKKSLTIGIAFLCVLICIVVVFVKRYHYEVDLQIKDQNGDDKTLCVITDELIRKYTEDYRSIKRKVTSKGLKSSGVTGYFEDCDNDYTYTKIGSLSGIYICNAFLGNGMEVEYRFTSNIESGNFRILIMDDTNDILFDIPIDSEEKVSFKSEVDKIYYVKFVGESAAFTVELWRETRT